MRTDEMKEEGEGRGRGGWRGGAPGGARAGQGRHVSHPDLVEVVRNIVEGVGQLDGDVFQVLEGGKWFELSVDVLHLAFHTCLEF